MEEQVQDVSAPEPTETGRIKQSLDAEVAAIRESHSLNDAGKRAAIEEAYTSAEKRYRETIARREREATERVVEAEKALFKLSSGHAEYRSALDRAEYAGFAEAPEVREKELVRMLDRATLVGDEKQAQAVFHIAVERGLEAVMNRYLEVRPEKARQAQRLMEAQDHQERVLSETGWAKAYPIRKPPELNTSGASPRW